LTEEEKAKSKEVTAKWKASGERLVAEDVVVPTYFHIINPSGNEINGNEQAQVDDLNEGFADTGFSFNLEEIIQHDNDDWWGFASDDTATDDAMKAATRQGDCGALNVWWTDLAGGTLGYAYFPERCPTWPDDDGVVMRHTTGVGGSEAPYNDGATLIHEVGHWMGLLHTFDGGCGGDGDLVDDTPEVADANYGSDCDAELDSCPNDGLGNDLLDNYMDYLDDVCLTSFTVGQKERMLIEWNEYRGSGAVLPEQPDDDGDGDDEEDDDYCCTDSTSMLKGLKGIKNIFNH